MEINIKGEPKEIAALVLALQEQQKEKQVAFNIQNDSQKKYWWNNNFTTE